jgi:hypothetical protein
VPAPIVDRRFDFALIDEPIEVTPAPREGFAVPLPDAAPARPAAPEVAEPPPRGALAAAPVPRLLVALHAGRSTGSLTLLRGPVKKVLVVDQGVPVLAASNVGAERFGPICVRRGLLGQGRLDALRKASPAARTADLLAEAGIVGPEKRAEILAGQIRAIAWSTFEWRDGTYEFQLGKPPAWCVPVKLRLGDLVLDGLRRASTLPLLRAELPADLHLAPTPEPAFPLYELTLRDPEAKLLTLADGTKSVADLLRLTDLPERDALAFLLGCRVTRVLDEAERVLASTRRMGFM